MEQMRKIVGKIDENGVVTYGYVTVHYIDESGQETQMPRDVELTPEQLAAFSVQAILSA